MSEENSVEQTDKPTLPVWGLVTSCYGLLYYRFTDFIRIMAVPAVVSVLLGWRSMGTEQAWYDASQSGNTEDVNALQMAMWSDPLTYVYAAVTGISMAAAIVAIHRLVLLNENPPRPLGINVGSRELRYIGYAIIVFLASWLPYVLSFAVIFALTLVPSGNPVVSGVQVAMVILVIPISIYTVMAMLRFSLALPAVAIDGQSGVEARLRTSWKLAKGSTFKLLVAMFLVAVPIALISIMIYQVWMDSLVAGSVTTIGGTAYVLLSTILSMALYFVQTAVISRAYQTLSGQTPLAQDG